MDKMSVEKLIDHIIATLIRFGDDLRQADRDDINSVVRTFSSRLRQIAESLHSGANNDALAEELLEDLETYASIVDNRKTEIANFTSDTSPEELLERVDKVWDRIKKGVKETWAETKGPGEKADKVRETLHDIGGILHRDP